MTGAVGADVASVPGKLVSGPEAQGHLCGSSQTDRLQPRSAGSWGQLGLCQVRAAKPEEVQGCEHRWGPEWGRGESCGAAGGCGFGDLRGHQRGERLRGPDGTLSGGEAQPGSQRCWEDHLLWLWKHSRHTSAQLGRQGARSQSVQKQREGSAYRAQKCGSEMGRAGDEGWEGWGAVSLVLSVSSWEVLCPFFIQDIWVLLLSSQHSSYEVCPESIRPCAMKKTHLLKTQDTRNMVHRTMTPQSPAKEAPWGFTQSSPSPSAAPSHFSESH